MGRKSPRPGKASFQTFRSSRTLLIARSFSCAASWKAHTDLFPQSVAPPSTSGVLQKHVFTGGSDGAIKLWDLSPQEPAWYRQSTPKESYLLISKSLTYRGRKVSFVPGLMANSQFLSSLSPARSEEFSSGH